MAITPLLQNPDQSNTPTTLCRNTLTTSAPLPNYMQVSQTVSPLKVSAYELQDDVMVALWGTFTSIYGKKFTEQFGEFCNTSGMTPTVRAWAQALSGIEPGRLERGLRACLERDSPWPPTLPEFIHLCAKKPWE